MKGRGQAVPLPPCPVPFLIEYLVEIGPVVPSGVGSAPIGWCDIVAWQACTAITLPPWQAQLLRRLSKEYLAMCRDAEKPDCPAPWQSIQTIESNRDKVCRRLGQALDALSRNPRKR